MALVAHENSHLAGNCQANFSHIAVYAYQYKQLYNCWLLLVSKHIHTGL